MEGFLSTLPPYVHTYLSKYPALDTFNVLKELVCFAVLYSTDRDRIMSITRELTSPMKEASIQEEEEEEEVIEQKCPQKKSAMINTFPEWWGHQESEPKTPSPRLPEKPDPPVESYWVSLGEDKPKRQDKNHIIPDLRAYPEMKRHSTMDLSTSVKAAAITRRLSMPVGDVKLTKQSSRSNLNPDLKSPRPNAAMRARAEHAKQQQEELLRKKASTPTFTTAAGQRLKERANSGIRWDEIKKERRSIDK